MQTGPEVQVPIRAYLGRNLAEGIPLGRWVQPGGGGRMSYGSPCGQGVGTSGTMPLLGQEAPGPVSDTGGVGPSAKTARRRRYQRSRQSRRQAVESLRKGRSQVDWGRCLDAIAEVVEGNCQGLNVRGPAGA